MQVRFEARVSDASDLEVTGSGLVVATWGDFLIAARATPSVATAGDADRRCDCEPSTTAAAASPACPCAVELVRTEWDATAQEQRREVMVSGTADDRRRRPGDVADHGTGVRRAATCSRHGRCRAIAR